MVSLYVFKQIRDRLEVCKVEDNPRAKNRREENFAAAEETQRLIGKLLAGNAECLDFAVMVHLV